MDSSLALLREMLGMEVALLTEVAAATERVRYCAGSWPGVGDLKGASAALEDTFCNLLLQGKIDNVVNDAHTDPRVADLSYPRRLGIGAYIGVPIRDGDKVYVLCCIARESHPELGPREVRVLEGFVRSMLDQLERGNPSRN